MARSIVKRYVLKTNLAVRAVAHPPNAPWRTRRTRRGAFLLGLARAAGGGGVTVAHGQAQLGGFAPVLAGLVGLAEHFAGVAAVEVGFGVVRF